MTVGIGNEAVQFLFCEYSVDSLSNCLPQKLFVPDSDSSLRKADGVCEETVSRDSIPQTIPKTVDCVGEGCSFRTFSLFSPQTCTLSVQNTLNPPCPRLLPQHKHTHTHTHSHTHLIKSQGTVGS